MVFLRNETTENGDTMSNNILMLHPQDTVVVALKQLKKGDEVRTKDVKEFAVLEDIPKSHKIALCDISKGEEIIKYGEIIAICSQDIKKGQWVYTHNLEKERWKK
jgi:altronate dehydratase